MFTNIPVAGCFRNTLSLFRGEYNTSSGPLPSVESGNKTSGKCKFGQEKRIIQKCYIFLKILNNQKVIPFS